MKRVLLLLCLLLASPAYASDGDIIVTARRVIERQTDTPVFVKYYSGTELEQSNAVQLEDVFGFSTRSNVSAGDALLFSMRGQAQPDLASTVDLSVGVYIDGVYAARTHGQNVPLLDIKNIQILRGPQGTFFGRNTTGGAVLIEYNNPVIGENYSTLTANYSRFDEFNGIGVVNSTLSDNVAVRVALQRISRESVSLDQVGSKFPRKDIWNGRIKLRHDTGTIVNTLSAEHYYNRGLSDQRFLVYAFPAAGPLTTSNVINEDARVNTDVQHYTLNSQIGENVKFTGGYRRVKSLNMTDYDGLPAKIHHVNIDVDIDQYTAELIYNGTSLYDRLNYTFGVNYFNESGRDFTSVKLLNDSITVNFDGRINNESYGVFGNATYHLTNKLSVDASARYTQDKKYLITPLVEDTIKDDNITWSAGVNYKFAEENMVFAKVSTGFKSGGLQLRAISSNDRPFAAERMIEYEVGIKGSYLDTLNYSVSGFYNRVKDGQVFSVYTGPRGPYSLITNAAEIRNYGIEAEVDAKITDKFTAKFSGAWTDPKYLKYTDPSSGADLRSNRFNTVIEKQFAVSGIYSSGPYLIRADYVWQDETPTNAISLATATSRYGLINGTKIVEETTIQKRGLLNLYADYRVTDKVKLIAWGRNVLNERFKKDSILIEGFTLSAAMNEPATYGVGMNISF